ncbi:MAG: hypothetical protein ACFFDW_02960 [Candidatus Thorarchaeota archaeon]
MLLMLILKNSPIPNWGIRKIAHLIGGTYIAFIVFQYENILGILFTIALFLVIFCILIIFSKGKIITEYFMLNCRKGEKNFTFLINTSITLIILLVSLFQLKEFPVAFTAGALVISWGDAFGEIIGKNYPIKKFKIFNEKSIAGSLAVYIFSVFAFIFSMIFYNYPITIFSIWKIILGGFICAIIEVFSWRWIDNILLPPVGNLIMLWIILT